ncbi:MAG: ubiquinol-cytochrome c reductase iron-sulfur subunit [Candidatus Acidiferrales bacterium]
MSTAPAATGKASAAAQPSVEPVALRRRIVWGIFWGFVATLGLMAMRFFFPRTIFEPKTIFTIGTAADFGLGVETKFQQDFRVWVVKKPDRLFVIYARCTHLGCTPDWKQGENKFKCPCHGSGYDSDGVNFEGPAPRPMDRAYVEINAQGEIVVDTSRLYQCEKGKRCQFDDGDGRSGAYIGV